MAAGTEIAKAYVQIIPKAEGITGKIAQALDPEARAAGQSAGTTIGDQIGSFAIKAIAALGIGKMISDSMTNGMDFETSMAKASTLFSGTAEELDQLQSSIIDISSATGVAAAELAEAAYSAESASIPMENLEGALEGAAKLAKAGFTDVDTALSATAKTMNAYGMVTEDAAETQANMEKVQRILIQTQNKGITTVGELGASLAQVTPTASAFGVSFEQVGASLAGMTAQGTPTAQATTQLNSLIAELGKNGTTAANNLAEAAEGTEYAGMSFNEMMAAGLDLNDVLGMMQGLAEENGLAMVDMFSSIEAGKAAGTIINSDWVGNMEAMATEADVVGDAYSTMADTTSAKLEQLKTTLTNMGIEAFLAVADQVAGAFETINGIFDAIQPSLSAVGEAFMSVISAFGDGMANVLGFDEGMDGTAVIADTLNAALTTLADVLNLAAENMDIIAPIALGLVGAFTAFKAVVGIQGAVGAVTTFMGSVGGLSGGLKALWGVITANPVALIIAALAAAAAAVIYLWNNSETFREIVLGVWEAVKTGIDAVIQFLLGLWEGMKEAWNALGENFESVKESILAVWDNIQAGIDGAVQFILGLWESFKEAWNAVGDAIGAVKDTIVGAWDTVKTKAGELKDSVVEKWDGLKETTSSAWDTVSTTVNEKMDAAREYAQGKLDNIQAAFDANGGGLQGAVSAAWTGIQEYYGIGFDAINLLTGGRLGEILESFTTKFGEIKEGISEKMTAAKEAIGEVLDNVKSAVKEKIDAALQWGKDLIGNFVQGIKDKIGDVGEAAKGIADKVAGFLHFSEPDVGPLSNFHTFMPDMIDLMTKGIQDGIPQVAMAMNGLTASMVPDSEYLASNNEDRMIGAIEGLAMRPVQTNVYLEGDARQLFRAVRRENSKITKSTGSNQLAYGGT